MRKGFLTNHIFYCTNTFLNGYATTVLQGRQYHILRFIQKDKIQEGRAHNREASVDLQDTLWLNQHEE